MKVVIQAGGKGTRLRPYTHVLPKPLLPVRSKPVLELLLCWLRRSGNREIYVTTGYLGHVIRAFCGDGHYWDLRIRYSEEREPLGTIGALSLLREELNETFLVVNGDVLSDLNIRAFVHSHGASSAQLSVATMQRTTHVDFGVIEADGCKITGFHEKPSYSHLVSMGIYCMEPTILDHIPRDVPFGFDDLVLRMLEMNAPINVYQHCGFWLDVGRIEDFQKAQEIDWDEGVHAIGDMPAFNRPQMQLRAVAAD